MSAGQIRKKSHPVTHKKAARERNRLAAMIRIQDIGICLFEKGGFGTTSVRDIAAAAEVSESSVYRYFGGKGGNLVWEPLDSLFEDELVSSLGTLPILNASEEAFAAAFSRLDTAQRTSLLARTKLAKNSTEAASAVMAQFQTDIAELTGAFAKPLRMRRTNPRPMLLARVVLECVDFALDRWQSSGGSKSLSSLIRESFAALRDLPGL
jgi:AcrR family transcriptional regulator